MIALSFSIAFCVLFLHSITLDGMIFQFVSKALWNLPSVIKKPLFDCPVCMVPWWGSLIIVLLCYHNNEWLGWLEWTLVLMTAGGINVLSNSIIEYCGNTKGDN